jgi:hypothetical protein
LRDQDISISLHNANSIKTPFPPLIGDPTLICASYVVQPPRANLQTFPPAEPSRTPGPARKCPRKPLELRRKSPCNGPKPLLCIKNQAPYTTYAIFMHLTCMCRIASLPFALKIGANPHLSRKESRVGCRDAIRWACRLKGPSTSTCFPVFFECSHSIARSCVFFALQFFVPTLLFLCQSGVEGCGLVAGEVQGCVFKKCGGARY